MSNTIYFRVIAMKWTVFINNLSYLKHDINSVTYGVVETTSKTNDLAQIEIPPTEMLRSLFQNFGHVSFPDLVNKKEEKLPKNLRAQTNLPFQTQI